MTQYQGYELHALADFLRDYSETAVLDVRYFIADLKQCALSDVYGTIYLSDNQMTQLQSMCGRRRNGEPVAYILGRVSFWNLELEINRFVLIPRPDTECLVSCVLEMHDDDARACLEFGVGSGAIALALACARSKWRIEGIDCSSHAIDLANKNRQRCGIESDRVVFYEDSWWSLSSVVVTKVYDLIVANPPYISRSSPDISSSVERYEPHLALYSDDDGLADTWRIIDVTLLQLRQGGWLYLEHGYDQAERVRLRLKSRGFDLVSTAQDYSGHDRVTYACKVE